MVTSSFVCGAEPGAARVVESTAAPTERTHRLFLGAEFKVKDEAGWHRVDGVEKGWFVASGEAVPVRIAMEGAGFEFAFDRKLKVSTQEIELLELNTRPAYTPTRDPGRRWVADQSMALSSAGQDVDAAANLLKAKLEIESQRQAMIRNLGGAVPPAAVQDMMRTPAPDIAGAMGDVAAASSSAGMGRYETGYEGRPGTDEDETSAGHDAVRVTAMMKSATTLENPHVLALVEFNVPDDVARHWRVFAEPLRPMAAGETQKLSFMKGGFPVGFTLGSVQLHFFDQGREIATSNAERLTALTRDEALQFAVLDHVSRHRDAEESGGAELAVELMTPGEREAWVTRGRRCYATILPNGRVGGVFADGAGKKPLGDPAVEAMVMAMGFRPAVTATGEAIESMIELTPGDSVLK